MWQQFQKILQTGEVLPDEEIWEHAAANGLMIVSKDNDFRQRSFVLGHPPKVVWLSVGNCPTSDILELLRVHRPDILEFEQDLQSAFLVIERPA